MRNYPHSRCLLNDVVFFTHTSPETARTGGGSYRNLFEVDMCINVVRFFLQNGYKPRQIVILTPYLGQLMTIQRKVRQKLKDIQTLIGDMDKADLIKEGIIDNLSSLDDGDDEGELEIPMGKTTEKKNKEMSNVLTEVDQGLRVSSVDNFQGEEADVVVLSLVRSNDRGDVGFLKEPERVNVLLSRAKQCMVLIGNSRTLLNSNKARPVWYPILDKLSKMGCLLDHIPTVCQLHPKDIAEVKFPDDFLLSRPNGGCTLPCTFRLGCGHVCPQYCHHVDREHEHVKCYKPCERYPEDCPHQHRCPKMCFEFCGPCQEIIKDVELKCGHQATAKCHDVSDTERRKKIPCHVKIPVVMPICNHDVTISCEENSKPQKQWHCPQPCGEMLECQHRCRDQCGECHHRGSHSAVCMEKCSRGPSFVVMNVLVDHAIRIVVRAARNVAKSANIQFAPKFAMRCALLASNLAIGNALTGENAIFHVEHLAIAYHVITVVRKFCLVVINALLFAVKIVLQKNIVKSAEARARRWWT